MSCTIDRFDRTDFLNHDSVKVATKSLPEYKQLREGFAGKNHKYVSRQQADSAPCWKTSALMLTQFCACLVHRQEGDPKKGVKAILKVADDPNPGLRLFLGADAYQVVQTKTKQVLDNLERYKDLTLSTDHDDVKQNGK